MGEAVGEMEGLDGLNEGFFCGDLDVGEGSVDEVGRLAVCFPTCKKKQGEKKMKASAYSASN